MNALLAHLNFSFWEVKREIVFFWKLNATLWMHIAALEACFCSLKVIFLDFASWGENDVFFWEKAWSDIKDIIGKTCLVQGEHLSRHEIYCSSTFRGDQRVNVHMDKKYGPAHWRLITPRQRLSLSTMSRDKDSGLGFSSSSRTHQVLIAKVWHGGKTESYKLLHSCDYSDQWLISSHVCSGVNDFIIQYIIHIEYIYFLDCLAAYFYFQASLSDCAGPPVPIDSHPPYLSALDWSFYDITYIGCVLVVCTSVQRGLGAKVSNSFTRPLTALPACQVFHQALWCKSAASGRQRIYADFFFHHSVYVASHKIYL